MYYPANGKKWRKKHLLKNKQQQNYQGKIDREVMTEQNYNDLRDQFTQLKFPEKLFSQLDFYYSIGSPDFLLGQIVGREGALTYYELYYRTNGDQECRLDKFNIRYRAPIEIPDLTINSVDTRDLDEKMTKLDWSYDHISDSMVAGEVQTKKEEEQFQRYEEALDKLHQLTGKSEAGNEIARTLMYKHWVAGYNFQFVPDLEKMRKQYELSETVSITERKVITAPEIVDRLVKKSIESPLNNSEKLRLTVIGYINNKKTEETQSHSQTENSKPSQTLERRKIESSETKKLTRKKSSRIRR